MEITVKELKEILNNPKLKDSDYIQIHDLENDCEGEIDDIILSDAKSVYSSKPTGASLITKEYSLDETTRKVIFLIDF